MKDHFWMPLYIEEIKKEAINEGLGADQFGIYLMLMFLAWDCKDAALPNDMDWLHAVLKRLLGVHGHQFNRIVPDVLEHFFTYADGYCTNKRLTKEKRKADRRTADAKHANDVRWANEEKNLDKSSADSNKTRHLLDPVGVQSTLTSTVTKKEIDREGSSDSVVVPPRKKKPLTSLPEDWTPSEDNTAYAVKKGWPLERVLSEGERFKNNHIARGSVFTDWDRAWQNWVTSPYQQQQLPRTTYNGTSSNSREQGKSDFKDALRKLGEYAEGNGGEISEEAIRFLPSARCE